MRNDVIPILGKRVYSYNISPIFFPHTTLSFQSISLVLFNLAMGSNKTRGLCWKHEKYNIKHL